MLEAFDRKIIEKLTKFSHWFQKLTGLTNFFFARAGLVILFASVIVDIANFFWPFLERKSSSMSILIFVLYIFYVNKRVRLTHKAEESLFAGEQIKIEKSSHWERIFWMFSTLLFAWFFYEILPVRFFLVEALYSLGFSVGLVIYLYFIEVVPLPPGKSKIRQWLGKFLALFTPQPQPEAVPVKSN